MGKGGARRAVYWCGPHTAYTMRVSLGPALRYIRATTIITIKITRTSSPAPTTTSIGNPNISTFLSSTRPDCLCRTSVQETLLRKFLPPLHVSDPLFIALNDHLGAFLHGLSVIAACACATADSS